MSSSDPQGTATDLHPGEVVAPCGDEPHALCWSADDESGAARRRALLADRLRRVRPDDLASVATEWNASQEHGPVRGAVIAVDVAEALAALNGPDALVVRPRRRARDPRPVALLLPGQGAQHVRMGAGLYRWSPAFSDAMDTFFDLFGAGGGVLRADWLSACSEVSIDDARRAQPLLLGLGHALGAVLDNLGVPPQVLLGHSVGETAAGVLAEVFEMADMVRLLRHRISLMDNQPRGGMLAVAAGTAELAPYLSDSVVVGAVNAPRQTVLAGPEKPLNHAADRLRAAGVSCQSVPSPLAFHSPALASIAEDSIGVLSQSRLCPPRRTIYSAYTGGPMRTEDACSPTFWARQVVDPVLFWPTLVALLSTGDYLLVDASPGQALARLARRHPAVVRGDSEVVAMLPLDPGRPVDDRRALVAAVARLWIEGYDVDPAAVRDRASS